MFKAKADKKVGKKVDIWALGVTMFYLLTGTHLFEGIKEEDNEEYKGLVEQAKQDSERFEREQAEFDKNGFYYLVKK